MKALFDRRLLRLRQARAAAHFVEADFLHEEMATRLCERLDDVAHPFASALILGYPSPQLTQALRQRPGTDLVITAALAHADASVRCDEEALPFADDSLDAIICLGNLHWVNDLPGVLVQIRRALKPDGLLLAAMPGGESLHELRFALTQAEIELKGGAAARVAPFVDIRDAGMLLQRAGFALPVADMDRIDLTYAHPLGLLRDLRNAGESSILVDGRPLSRPILARAIETYQQHFTNPDGRVRATADLLFLTAWKPHPTQQQPLKPGSAQNNLAKALGVPLHVVEGRKGPKAAS